MSEKMLRDFQTAVKDVEFLAAVMATIGEYGEVWAAKVLYIVTDMKEFLSKQEENHNARL